MKVYEEIIRIIDVNIVYCLIPMILSLMGFKAIFKDKLPIEKALNVVKWFIILYTTVSIIYYAFGAIFHPDQFSFIQRATGPYKMAYWIMLLSSLLPLTLFIKKLASNFYYILLVAFLMKLGVFFEQFVIIVTSIHRDYAPDSWSNGILHSWIFNVIVVCFQGLLISILLLGLLKMLVSNRPLKNEQN